MKKKTFYITNWKIKNKKNERLNLRHAPLDLIHFFEHQFSFFTWSLKEFVDALLYLKRNAWSIFIWLLNFLWVDCLKDPDWYHKGYIHWRSHKNLKKKNHPNKERMLQAKKKMLTTSRNSSFLFRCISLNFAALSFASKNKIYKTEEHILKLYGR